MLFARNFGVSSPHDTCGWHSCAECRLKLGCVRVCTHSILCVYARALVYVCVSARANTRRGLFLLPFSVACISPALSGPPFIPFRSPGVLSGSLTPSLAAHFFLVSADEDRSLATRREDEEWKMRGVEGEKKRPGVGGRREEPKERSAGRKSERETGRAERVDRWAPTTPKVRALPPAWVRRVDGGDDARFINICRRTLNSSLVANENRYRVWSWRSSTRANLTRHYSARSEFNYFLKGPITPVRFNSWL